jgi:hypothetical protein
VGPCRPGRPSSQPLVFGNSAPPQNGPQSGPAGDQFGKPWGERSA